MYYLRDEVIWINTVEKKTDRDVEGRKNNDFSCFKLYYVKLWFLKFYESNIEYGKNVILMNLR